MSKIEQYGLQQNYYETVQAKKDREAKDAKEAEKSGKAGQEAPVKLSERAKKLLEELRKTYGNMDIMVANYKNNKEAASYLARGTKEYSVLIEPELLEKMAADEDTKNKYLGILEDATSKLADLKDQLGDKADDIRNLGVSIDKDGKMTFFAELERMSERRREQLEEAKEARKEEKAAEKAKQRREEMYPDWNRRARLEASTLEELLEKIRNFDFASVPGSQQPGEGGRFDYSI